MVRCLSSGIFHTETKDSVFVNHHLRLSNRIHGMDPGKPFIVVVTNFSNVPQKIRKHMVWDRPHGSQHCSSRYIRLCSLISPSPSNTFPHVILTSSTNLHRRPPTRSPRMPARSCSTWRRLQVHSSLWNTYALTADQRLRKLGRVGAIWWTFLILRTPTIASRSW